MEESCTCQNCGRTVWIIFKDRIQCPTCDNEILFEEDLLASELLLVDRKE